MLFGILLPQSVQAQSDDDIEVTDSTSTEWGGGGGGELGPDQPTGPVTSISLSKTSLTLEGGKYYKLVATINSDAQNKTVNWKSSNSKVASVDSYGLVRGLTVGNATITATAAGNTALEATCEVTVTSDYNGIVVPAVPFEFCFSAADYDASYNTIPNHPQSNLRDAQLQLSENIPSFVNGEFLRITSRCEGFINRWNKGDTESGGHFYRQGTDCMTIVAKVTPKFNTGNTCDFITNRGGGYNWMWRIGDNNSSFLHTGTGYADDRALPLSGEQPQLLAVRVDGKNDYILLQNLTTGESKRIDGVNWGGDNNVFKLFYNDGGEYFLGDFYWMYLSFELLTDSQLDLLVGLVHKGDVNGDGEITAQDASLVLQLVAKKIEPTVDGIVYEAADVNGDGDVTAQDASLILQYVAKKISW